MDFTLPPEVDEVRRQIRAFVDERLIPLESDPASYDGHENIDETLLETVRAEARAKGLWSLSMPVERGGRGFNTVGMAACYEEMNRSIFGPVCFNAAAPDDGNMFLLNRVATTRRRKSGCSRSSTARSAPPS